MKPTNVLVLLFLTVVISSCVFSKDCNLKRINLNNLTFYNRNLIVYENNFGELDTLKLVSKEDKYINQSENSIYRKLDCQHYLVFTYKFRNDNIELMFKKKEDINEFFLWTDKISYYSNKNVDLEKGFSCKSICKDSIIRKDKITSITVENSIIKEIEILDKKWVKKG